MNLTAPQREAAQRALALKEGGDFLSITQVLQEVLASFGVDLKSEDPFRSSSNVTVKLVVAHLALWTHLSWDSQRTVEHYRSEVSALLNGGPFVTLAEALAAMPPDTRLEYVLNQQVKTASEWAAEAPDTDKEYRVSNGKISRGRGLVYLEVGPSVEPFNPTGKVLI